MTKISIYNFLTTMRLKSFLTHKTRLISTCNYNTCNHNRTDVVLVKEIDTFDKIFS